MQLNANNLIMIDEWPTTFLSSNPKSSSLSMKSVDRVILVRFYYLLGHLSEYYKNELACGVTL